MKEGFTLIELLVVVLIIAILAAIAVPQYQKAVEKSRTAEAKLLVKNLADAQNRFFLENDSYATSFDELDIDFPFPISKSSPLNHGTPSQSAVKLGNKFELLINSNNSTFNFSRLTFSKGNYKYGGFAYVHMDPGNILPADLYCVESTAAGKERGFFCNKIMGASYYNTIGTTLFFKM